MLRPRSERPVHEQLGGAGPADDEAAHENPGRVPVLAGARDFATLRSVLSTARKQGHNRIEALQQGPTALLAGLQS